MQILSFTLLKKALVGPRALPFEMVDLAIPEGAWAVLVLSLGMQGREGFRASGSLLHVN